MHQMEAGERRAGALHAARPRRRPRDAFPRRCSSVRPPGDLPRCPRDPEPRCRGGLLPVPLLRSHLPDDAGAAEGAWTEPVGRVAPGARPLRRVGAPHARAGRPSHQRAAPSMRTSISGSSGWRSGSRSPECDPICCDANSPLPFARDTFSHGGAGRRVSVHLAQAHAGRGDDAPRRAGRRRS